MKAAKFDVFVFYSIYTFVVPAIAHRYEGKHSKDSLQLVHVVFRHGDRTNDKFVLYPKDPYKNESYFPYGHGQLTNIGKKEMYKLGEELEYRYGHFLEHVYIPSNVEAWSSDTDRTKASLLAVLASLFPPKWDEALDDGLLWQPIPYSHLPSAEDKLFNGALSSEFRKSYVNYLRATPAAAEDFLKQKDLFKYVSEHTGWNVTNYEKIYYLYLCLKTEVRPIIIRSNCGPHCIPYCGLTEEWGLKLPEWTKRIWPEVIEDIVQKQYFSATATPELRQITSGALLQKIVEDTQAKIQELPTKKDRKIILYSGHDFNIAFLLSTLDILKPHIPPYGSYLTFEVHKINRIWGVRILYQDYHSKEPEVLKLPACEKFCEINKFISVAKEYFPSKNEQNKINVA